MAKLALVLLIGVAATGCSGQFLKHLNLPKIPSPNSISVKSPAQLAEAAAKTAAKAAEAGRDAVAAVATNSESALEAAEAAAQQGKQALDSSKPQAEVAKALDAAADALKHASDHIAAANASDVTAALSNVGDSALPQGKTVADIASAAQKSTKSEVADTIREMVPQVSGAVDRTGHQVAETVQREIPRAAALVNRTGSNIATAIGGPAKPVPGSELPADDEDAFGQRNLAPLAGLMLLVVTAVAAYVVAQRFKGGARSPMLLSDALDGTARNDSPQARGSMQMTSGEATGFARF
mmetsp:Transcript_108032/g.344979  ORF Transcript_108032/g.344979 Transcript_108032/m.344979 type:complete len:295 (+) Transcript_108032:95-979(+)|eukprot:CAMPEP_0203965066 /NCGR_PEP_ID=MMETSP0359-20131031/94655_1 /ASSEMBLY_ACC=CAM_ASM_000338 /TAXON_ID=268821 /ORGANISM="Scrippsiella Hangoei, Strain SHTV-5" /LENGTH=294 /DNA_ID=CAMNT_0050901793 /DNA_START=95 /DNA_END=979 /DNA_ORIENTATION=-